MTRPALVSGPSRDRDIVPKRQNGPSLSLIKLQSHHHAGFAHRGESSRNPACLTVRSDEGNCARRSKGFLYVPRACVRESLRDRDNASWIADDFNCGGPERVRGARTTRRFPPFCAVGQVLRACARARSSLSLVAPPFFAVSTSPLFGIWTETPH